MGINDETKSFKLRKKAEKLVQHKFDGIKDKPVDLDDIIYELRVHQFELEIQNEELIEAQLKLEDSRSKYFDLYNLAPVGYFKLDKKGLIIDVNLTGASMLNTKIKDLFKTAFIQFISTDSQNKFYHLSQKSMKTGNKESSDIKMITKDNKIFFAHFELIFNESKTSGLKIAIFDINESKKLEEINLRLAAIVDYSNDAIIGKDLNGIITSWNHGAHSIYGYSKEEVFGKSISILIPPNHIDNLSWIMEELIKDKPIISYETVRKKKNGTNIDVSLTISPIKDLDGNIIGASTIARDITQNKRANKLIKSSLEEKEILLKEIHHRVKNNLMIISSLLNLQSSYLKDKASKDIFLESQNRAKSMALIHERLYQSTDLKKIDFGDYVQKLSNNLYNTYVLDTSLIKLNIDVDEVMLDIDQSIPLGLIVNELVTNSLKHAFPQGESGEINIKFHTKDDKYMLEVNDNGMGFPPNIDYKNSQSLGLRLVTSLTEQINGKIEFKNIAGTSFKIIFKEEKFDK